MNNLTVTIASAPPATCVHVCGDLAYGSTAILVDAVAALCTPGAGVEQLHLDFTELTFCDSAGLSALLLIHRQTCDAGIPLHLDHRPAHLQRVLEITGLLDHLTTSAVQTPANDPDETEIG
ncbi:STAS domain-containing protein [Mycobacterium sp. SMC-4]|uniref:STAS domain-containing protein n=1 Tax=Mycobacterium sp. SMC-4 TaxID=2857059 RepID=UPI0021B22734|nr:STAS domain-containing protein [Mycobacterium sp. SMC-4]UXA17984.1 STAS domain-containing protein [Mycobacterium sp. SMC-4]